MSVRLSVCLSVCQSISMIFTSNWSLENALWPSPRPFPLAPSYLSCSLTTPLPLMFWIIRMYVILNTVWCRASWGCFFFNTHHAMTWYHICSNGELKLKGYITYRYDVVQNYLSYTYPITLLHPPPYVPNHPYVRYPQHSLVSSILGLFLL